MDRDSFVILDIYFNNLIYSTTDEQPVFGFNTFLSNTGGQLSVWLGIRLVTVIQVIYYISLSCLLIIPFVVRRLLYHYGLRKPRPGDITEFRPPVTLFPTASLSLFQRGLLAPSTILHPNHPEILMSRQSTFGGGLANGREGSCDSEHTNQNEPENTEQDRSNESIELGTVHFQMGEEDEEVKRSRYVPGDSDV